MNAHDRRKHERVLLALLTRNKRNSTLRHMPWKHVHALRMKCFASATHTAHLRDLEEDGDLTRPVVKPDRLVVLREAESRGDLSQHDIRVQPTFTKRYPRAAAVLPDFYRRLFKQNVKMMRFGVQYHASAETIAKILSGEAEEKGLLVATASDKGLRHLAKMQNFYDSPFIRQSLVSDAVLRAESALRLGAVDAVREMAIDSIRIAGGPNLLCTVHDSVLLEMPPVSPAAVEALAEIGGMFPNLAVKGGIVEVYDDTGADRPAPIIVPFITEVVIGDTWKKEKP